MHEIKEQLFESLLSYLFEAGFLVFVVLLNPGWLGCELLSHSPVFPPPPTSGGAVMTPGERHQAFLSGLLRIEFRLSLSGWQRKCF